MGNNVTTYDVVTKVTLWKCHVVAAAVAEWQKNKGDISVWECRFFRAGRLPEQPRERLKKSVYAFIYDERVNGLVGNVLYMLPIFSLFFSLFRILMMQHLL